MGWCTCMFSWDAGSSVVGRRKLLSNEEEGRISEHSSWCHLFLWIPERVQIINYWIPLFPAPAPEYYVLIYRDDREEGRERVLVEEGGDEGDQAVGSFITIQRFQVSIISQKDENSVQCTLDSTILTDAERKCTWYMLESSSYIIIKLYRLQLRSLKGQMGNC